MVVCLVFQDKLVIMSFPTSSRSRKIMDLLSHRKGPQPKKAIAIMNCPKKNYNIPNYLDLFDKGDWATFDKHMNEGQKCIDKLVSEKRSVESQQKAISSPTTSFSEAAPLPPALDMESLEVVCGSSDEEILGHHILSDEPLEKAISSLTTSFSEVARLPPDLDMKSLEVVCGSSDEKILGHHILSDVLKLDVSNLPEIQNQYFQEWASPSSSLNQAPKYKRKENMCYYCEPQKSIKNLCRHLTLIHKTELDVIKMMSLPLGSKERRNVANEIRNKGNYLYYSHENSFRPYRKPKDLSPKKENYVFCSFCLRTIKRHSFYRHLGICDKNTENIIKCQKCDESFKKGNLIKHLTKCPKNYDVTPPPKKPGQNSAKINKRVLQELAIVPKTNYDLADDILVDVLPVLKNDHIGIAVRNDPLILGVGACLRENHKESRAKVQITSKMRDLAKLLNAMQKHDNSIKCLRDCLKLNNSSLLLSSIQELSGLSKETGIVKTPSLSKRLLTPLTKAFNLVIKEIRMDPSLTYDLKKQFEYDFKVSRENIRNEWACKISTNAEKSRKRNRRNQEVLMPSSSDIRKSLSLLKHKEELLYKELLKKVTPASFERMCQLLICDIIIFNGRRSGEPTRATLSEYMMRKEMKYEENFNLVISEEELKANEDLTVFEVEGKNTKNVQIYLTKAMKKCTDLLITLRSSIGIDPKNPLLYPRTASFREYNPQRIMSILRTEMGLNLDYPSAMTGQGVRREIATHNQLRNPNKPGYVSLLASHMGHDEKTHKENYRLPIRPLLMSQVGTDLIRRRVEANKTVISQLDFDHTVDEEKPESPGYRQEDTWNDSPNSSTSCDELPIEKEKVNRKRIKVGRTYWTPAQENLVLTAFMDCFKNGKNPGEKRCADLISQHEILSERTWAQLNSFIDNTRRKKRPILKGFEWLLNF